MAQTVFERAGGFAAVRKIVSEFYDRIFESEELRTYFEGVSMPRLIDHQTRFISAIMGGPASVSDEVLQRAHAPLRISHDHFIKVANLLCEVLEDHDLEPVDVDHVRREIIRRETFIVREQG